MSQPTLCERALAYFEQNLALRIDMREMLQHRNVPVLHLSDRACLLGYHGPDTAQLAADDADAGEKALRAAGPMRLVVAHGQPAFEAVHRVYPAYGCSRPCHLAYYPGTEPHAVPPSCTIAPYPQDRIDTVLEHYQNISDPAYIQDRIDKGDLFAGYYEGELCGFIGFHDDGSMGMLEVFPAFRRLGVGFALEQNLINVCLTRNRTPYCHIFEGNTASIRLQQKLGLLITPACEVAWLHPPRE